MRLRADDIENAVFHARETFLNKLDCILANKAKGEMPCEDEIYNAIVSFMHYRAMSDQHSYDAISTQYLQELVLNYINHE